MRGLLVEVETDVSTGGLPSFTLVGLPDAAVRESRERVLSALRHSGMALPPRRVTVNLAPGHVHKAGPALDLSIATALASAAGFVPPESVADVVLIGELSLGGHLKPVRGVLPMVLAARAAGRSTVIVSAWNAEEAALVPGVQVFAARTLDEVVEHLRAGGALVLVRGAENGDGAERPIPYWRPRASGTALPRQPARPALDLADVRGQHHARRALEIAAAGRHNLLLVGPPGTGKTLLASRLPGILPPLDREEALEVTQIHSVVSRLGRGLVRERPFRAPHHSISEAGLIGGGEGPRPGEMSLAHRGVLFLDELPEFRRNALEALRQPLEEGVVRLVRARGLEEFPADFQLVAAMNPCPCGFIGDPRRACTCPPRVVQTYRARVSGPLLDRIDMWVHVPPLTSRDLADGPAAESSSAVQERVVAARGFAHERHAVRDGATARPALRHLYGTRLRAAVGLAADASRLLERALDRHRLSARGHDRLLRVARTIANLAECSNVTEEHVAEALLYRPAELEPAGVEA